MLIPSGTVGTLRLGTYVSIISGDVAKTQQRTTGTDNGRPAMNRKQLIVGLAAESPKLPAGWPRQGSAPVTTDNSATKSATIGDASA